MRFGANVQPGQIVIVGSEPGKEPLARAIAEVAYRSGAKFVDLAVFDLHFKRARVLHADPDTLEIRAAVARGSECGRSASSGARRSRSPARWRPT